MIFAKMIGSRPLQRTNSMNKNLLRLSQAKTGKAGEAGNKVVTSSVPDTNRTTRLGFMAGQGSVPDDFDTMCQDEIIALFEGEE